MTTFDHFLILEFDDFKRLQYVHNGLSGLVLLCMRKCQIKLGLIQIIR